MFVDLIAWIILFIIAILCLVLHIKQRKFHPEIFELMDDEQIVKLAKGDYWTSDEDIRDGQNSGEFVFTNKRILFKGTYFISQDKNIIIPYEQVATIEKTIVGYILPVAFNVITKTIKNISFLL